MDKKFYLSRTFWVNILAVIALIVQSQFGYIISPETQVSILAVLNILLRAITKTEITW